MRAMTLLVVDGSKLWMLIARLLLLAFCLVVCFSTNPAKSSPIWASLSSSARDTIYVDGGSSRLSPVGLRIRARDNADWKRALKLHYNALVIDGHIDTPTLIFEQDYEIGEWHTSAAVDLPRMNSGGLDAAFFAIFTPSIRGNGKPAFDYVLDVARKVKEQVEGSEFAELVSNSDDILRISRAEKKAIIFALEGGNLLSGDFSRIQELHDLGIRYVTISHNRSHSWADSALDSPLWNGIGDIGDKIIQEMNRVGIILDVSHTSDEVVKDASEISIAPIIASHSSARGLVNHPRNLSDESIQLIAGSGGIIMINFYDMLINTAFDASVMDEVEKMVNTQHDGNLRMYYRSTFQVKSARGIRNARVDDILDHIDYVVKLVGVDHVGLGSDFDGAAGPVGMENVSKLPYLTYGLVKRGYSDEEIYKILGSNLIRVLKRVEEIAEVN